MSARFDPDAFIAVVLSDPSPQAKRRRLLAAARSRARSHRLRLMWLGRTR